MIRTTITAVTIYSGELAYSAFVTEFTLKIQFLKKYVKVERKF